MSLIVKVTGGEDFEIAKECVQKVKFTADIPLDSNARTKDVGSTLIITGKILVASNEDPFDSTRQLALWSLVPAEDPTAYRNVEVTIINAGVTERTYTFPRAFVVDYKEDFGNADGIGTFTIMVKQKKDRLELVAVDGGFAS